MRYFILLVKEKLPETPQQTEILDFFEQNYDRKIIAVQSFSNTIGDIKEELKNINLEYPSYSSIEAEFIENEDHVFLRFDNGQLFSLVFYSEKI
jgi:hypothetical protein